MALSDYIALLEHLPKVGALLNRLLPLLEGRFSPQNSASTEELRSSMEALRSDVGKVTAQQASLYRQLNEQGEQINHLREDIRTAQTALDTIDTRLDRLEKKWILQMLILLSFFVITVVALITLLIMVRHRVSFVG